MSYFFYCTRPFADSSTGKRVFATLAIFSATLFGVSGCGGSSDSATTEEPARGKIVYVGSEVGPGNNAGTSGINLMNPDGTGIKRLLSHSREHFDAYPSISPDGSKIVFVSNRENCGVGCSLSDTYPMQVWVMNMDGSQIRRLTSSSNPLSRPSFSPDGSKVIFTRSRDGGANGDICWVSTNGGEITTIPRSFGGVAYYASFSPDGSRIVFNSYRGDSSGIFIMNADGTGETLLVVDGWAPSFSPDGSRITFCRLTPGDPFSHTDIYVINADGTGEKRLTGDPGNDDFPSFSPDGKRIVFQSDRDIENTDADNTASRVFVMRDDGSNQVPISAIRFESIFGGRRSNSVGHRAWALSPVP